MNKNFLAIVVLFLTTTTFALPFKLKCSDVSATNSTMPLMTIDMTNEHIVKSVTFNYSEKSVYQYLPKNLGANGNQSYFGSTIDNRRSPYDGHTDYQLLTGMLRLVLNKDLTEQGLKSADVDGRKQGHAAVLVVAQEMHRMWSGGDIYVRFKCQR